MVDKTQKIADAIHKELKILAANESKTLQEVTEELLREGLKSKGVEVAESVENKRK